MNKKLIEQKLKLLGSKYDVRNVFEDFVICIAFAISNRFNYEQEKEDNYLSIAKKYNIEDLNIFAEMFAHLVMEYTKEEPEDILGELFEEFGLSSKDKGQFFTPISVCDLMASITFDEEKVKSIIKEKGFFSINDPACGSGRMLISSLKKLQDIGIYNNNLFFEGDDISLFCTCMTYINLSLLGVNAVVKNKDTLANKINMVFYTPSYINYFYPKYMKKQNEMGLENG